MKIYSPRHKQAVYEVDLPFHDDADQQKYWVGFCLRGGQGINGQSVTIADPSSLSNDRPVVYKSCVTDPKSVATVGISQPTSLQAKQVTQDYAEITWEEPTKDGGATISHYRLFI